MKRACLIVNCLVCSVVYGYEPAFEDKIAVLDIDESVSACKGEDTMSQSGRREHPKKARKQVRREGSAPQSAMLETTLNINDVDSVNRREGSAPLSVMQDSILKIEDEDSVNCSEKKVAQLARVEKTLVLSSSTIKVAIRDILDKENILEYADKVIIRTCLSDAVENYGRETVEVYECANENAIVDERSFQLSGHVQESQIKRIGPMMGVDYILISEVIGLGNKQILLTAKLVNVTTGKIEGGTPTKRCDMDYNDYCVACRQIVEILLTRLVE